MIQELILKDFESHKNTVLNFNKGFNVISAENNVGKTSIVRAINLVAYNKFDQGSVRIGADNCDVTVKTERGTVRVLKGKKNEWYVTPKGGKTEFFEKIGKGVLSQASYIVGLKTVELGGLDLSVNVMNQLEGHFMMSEMNGKDASGSLRAQVVDEVSGLTGIEGLIRDVSLDSTRRGKEVKAKEIAISDDKELLLDELELEREKNQIEKAESLLSDVDESELLVELALKSHKKFEEVNNSVSIVEENLKKVLDFEKASSQIDGIDLLFEALSDSKKINNSQLENNDMIEKVENVLKNIPNIDKSNEVLGIASELVSLLNDAESVKKLFDNVSSDIARIESVKINEVPNSLVELIEEYQVMISEMNSISSRSSIIDNRIKELESEEVLEYPIHYIESDMDSVEIEFMQTDMAEKLLLKHLDVQDKIEASQININNADDKLSKLKEEEEEILKTITVCPLTLKPAKCTQGE